MCGGHCFRLRVRFADRRYVDEMNVGAADPKDPKSGKTVNFGKSVEIEGAYLIAVESVAGRWLKVMERD